MHAVTVTYRRLQLLLLLLPLLPLLPLLLLLLLLGNSPKRHSVRLFFSPQQWTK